MKLGEIGPLSIFAEGSSAGVPPPAADPLSEVQVVILDVSQPSADQASAVQVNTGLAQSSGRAWLLLGIDLALPGGPILFAGTCTLEVILACSGDPGVAPDDATRSVIWRWDAESFAGQRNFLIAPAHRFPDPGLLFVDPLLVIHFDTAATTFANRCIARVYYRHTSIDPLDYARLRRA